MAKGKSNEYGRPKKVTWWIAFILLLVGGISFILSLLGIFSLPNNLDMWFMLASAVLYALGTSVRGI
jgi:hypothetical protein